MPSVTNSSAAPRISNRQNARSFARKRAPFAGSAGASTDGVSNGFASVIAALLARHSALQDNGLRWRLSANEVGGLVGDHHDACVEVGGEHHRHDRRVNDAQALESAHAQFVINYARRIVLRAHAARAHWVERGRTALLGGAE